mgnify:CR=1 FL=1
MFDFETRLAGIAYKVRQLIDENRRLREETLRLQERLEEQQEQNSNQQKEINNLKEQNKILKLRNALEHKGDTTEVKLKINQLIRSIDTTLSNLQSEQ